MAHRGARGLAGLAAVGALFLLNLASAAPAEGELHHLLLRAWDEALFKFGNVRFDALAALPGPWRNEHGPGAVRTLPGRLGMVAQASPHRASKRPLNRTSLETTLLPFDLEHFHFGKVSKDEVSLCFSPSMDKGCDSPGYPATCQRQHLLTAAGESAADACPAFAASVLMNVNPVCSGHLLLVPNMTAEQPQVLTPAAVYSGLAFSFLASPRMWLSFNSIGAGASVNHLHWQGFYPGDAVGEEFPLAVLLKDSASAAAAAVAPRRGGVSLRRTPQEWPLPGWVFAWEGEPGPALVDSMSDRLFALVQRLQEYDMAHNVLLASSGSLAVVFPRRVANTQGTDVSRLQVAGHEVLGWWIVPRTEDFEAMDEASAAALLAQAALPVEDELKVMRSLQDDGWEFNSAAVQDLGLPRSGNSVPAQDEL